MEGRLLHFGVWIKKSDKNKISRNNYAVIDKKNSTWTPRTASRYSSEVREKYYEDKECKVYSDSFCEEFQERCLINYDKNMAFFGQISRDEFEAAIHSMVTSNKEIRQIHNLNDCDKMCGIYIMVLDEYKQVYIGQSRNIKSRIISHWNKRKQFDRLLFGGVNNSIFSIDSFGALDTTRIFVLETDDLDYYEMKLQKKISPQFILNRIAGGVPEDSFDLLVKALDRNSRNLEQFHNEEFAEKYEKDVVVLHFTQIGYCKPEELARGDVVCIERTNRGKLLPDKLYGKVRKATKSRIWIHRYRVATKGYFCEKNITEWPEEIRIRKTLLISKVSVNESIEQYVFWRSKKYPHLEA